MDRSSFRSEASSLDAAFRASVRQSVHGAALRYSGFGDAGAGVARVSSIRFAAKERLSIEAEHGDDTSSVGSAHEHSDRISELLASQQRVEQQLSFLSSGFQDVRRYVFDIHRVVAGDEGQLLANGEDPRFAVQVSSGSVESSPAESSPPAISQDKRLQAEHRLEDYCHPSLSAGSGYSTVVVGCAEEAVPQPNDSSKDDLADKPCQTVTSLEFSDTVCNIDEAPLSPAEQGRRELAKRIERATPDDGLVDSDGDDDGQSPFASERRSPQVRTSRISSEDRSRRMSVWTEQSVMVTGSAYQEFCGVDSINTAASQIQGQAASEESRRTASTGNVQEISSTRTSVDTEKSSTVVATAPEEVVTAAPGEITKATPSGSKRVSVESTEEWKSQYSELSAGNLLNLLEEHGSVFAKQQRPWRPPPSLPQDWPGMLKLHPALTNQFSRHSGNRNQGTTLYLEDARSVHGQDMLAMAPEALSMPQMSTRPMRTLGRMIMRPMSLRRILLDIVGLFVLGYDLFLTPFMLAWDISLVGTIRVFAWMSVCFWVVDMLASFMTGYYKNGVLEMRPAKVAQRYLQSWLFLDITVIICDLFSLLSSSGTQNDSKAAGVLRFSKLSRLIRIITVLRLTRLADISARLTDWGITQRWTIIAEITKLLVGICWIAHAVSCAWYAVGAHGPSDTGGRWVGEYALPGRKYTSMPMEFQYTTSLHWSLAQITPGSMSVQPLNTAERIFNVVCLLCGLFFFTSLISSLSTKMVHFRMMKQEEAMMFVRLRKYLLQESVGHQLAVTVQKQLRDRLARQKMLAVEDVPAIALLSLSTRMELHFEVCKPHLRHYPFFHLWANIDVSSFRKFCFKAIKFIYLPQGETLFLPGTQAKEAYHVCDGRLTYHPEVHYRQDSSYSAVPVQAHTTARSAVSASYFLGNTKTGHSADDGHHQAPGRHEGIIVEPGAWLCEGALWTQWYHVGTAIAGSRCKLLTCNGQSFVKELMAHRLTRPIAMEYGALYHARLIRSFPPHSEAPDDLKVPHTTSEEIIARLENDVRCFVSSIAYNTLSPSPTALFSKRGGLAAKCTEELSMEVLEGKTILTFDPIHTVTRVVQLSIAVITMDDNDSQILVQLGKEEAHSRRIRFSAVYPGIKQDGKESPSETTCRLLETTLKPLLPGLTMGKNFLETEVKLSTRYNLQTKYLRTVQEMTMNSEFVKQRKRFQIIHPKSSVHSHQTSASGVALRRTRSSQRIDDTGAQLSASMRSSMVGSVNTLVSIPGQSKHVLRRLRPRRVLQNVFGYAGEVDPVDIVERIQMFLLNDDDGCVVCAWMSNSEFEVLANPDNEDYLQHWFRDHVTVEDVVP